MIAMSGSAHKHPTVKPTQLLRDEVRIVIRGDNLNEQLEGLDSVLASDVGELLDSAGIEYDEIEIEHDKERQ